MDVYDFLHYTQKAKNFGKNFHILIIHKIIFYLQSMVFIILLSGLIFPKAQVYVPFNATPKLGITRTVTLLLFFNKVNGFPLGTWLAILICEPATEYHTAFFCATPLLLMHAHSISTFLVFLANFPPPAGSDDGDLGVMVHSWAMTYPV